MNIILKSPIIGNYKVVMAAFDRRLFESLKPTVGEMEIVEFTGSEQGDKVHMKFIKPIQAEWVSEIIKHGETESEAWFVDVGVKLPWPLASWTHRHIVQKVDEHHSLILDDMTFTGKNALLTLLLYPAIFIGFYPRKKIYKTYFEQLAKH